LDKDGDPDAYIGNAEGQILFFEHTNGTFVQNDAENPFAGIGTGPFAEPNFFDVDGDGDLDALVGNLPVDPMGTYIVYYENTSALPPPQAIPTMSQWSRFLFLLLLLTMATVGIKNLQQQNGIID
jgi:hypothetical protein